MEDDNFNLPDDINPDKQKLSEASVKKMLLKNLIPIKAANGDERKLQVYTEINNFLKERVETFLKILPEDTNPNKIEWYFEIYKEGYDILNENKLSKRSEEEIKDLIASFKNKSITDYCKMGSCFLADVFATLSAYYRDKLLEDRLKTVYTCSDPKVWFENAEELTVTKIEDPDVALILDIIQLLKSRKV